MTNSFSLPYSALGAQAGMAQMTEEQTKREKLLNMLQDAVGDKPFSELTSVTYDHFGSKLAGEVFLNTLESQGISLEDFDAVGALTTAAIPLAIAIIHTAAQRGYALDAFVMDFVFPSIKGPSVSHKRVVMVDAWLSEKSFVQTSSLVTLRNGNELNLDFAVLQKEGARVVAIVSLIGSVGKAAKNSNTIELINPVTDEHSPIRFIPVFSDNDLRGNFQQSVQGDQ